MEIMQNKLHIILVFENELRFGCMCQLTTMTAAAAVAVNNGSAKQRKWKNDQTRINYPKSHTTLQKCFVSSLGMKNTRNRRQTMQSFESNIIKFIGLTGFSLSAFFFFCVWFVSPQVKCVVCRVWLHSSHVKQCENFSISKLLHFFRMIFIVKIASQEIFVIQIVHFC